MLLDCTVEQKKITITNNIETTDERKKKKETTDEISLWTADSVI